MQIAQPHFPVLAGRYPPGLPGASAPGSEGAGTSELSQVAQGFEALFLRQLLSAAAAADFGGEDLFGSSAGDTFRELRDARFAEIAAGSGTLGLAAQIEAQLARHLPPGGEG